MSYIKIPYVKGKKNSNILVVGESYYSDYETYHSTPEKLPHRVRNDWLDGTSDIPYFNHLDEFLRDYGIANSLEDVTFYNYYQKVMKYKDENLDKIEMNNSGKAFYKVIDKLKPDAIIFFSITTYNSVPHKMKNSNISYLSDKGNKIYSFKNNNNHSDNAYLCYYLHDKKEIPLLAFPHLTRKYSVMKVTNGVRNKVIDQIIEDSRIRKLILE